MRYAARWRRFAPATDRSPWVPRSPATDGSVTRLVMCRGKLSRAAAERPRSALPSGDGDARAQNASQGRRDLRHLALGHLREERQRDRARGDVLAHRELALAVAEALAVEAQQVDGGEVRLARDPPLRQRDDRRVAIDPPRQLHD